ncbi:hypothetical protein [Dinghuibacter silviterrae]|uniref:Uncharacterized protein n=1 Tax=Dinghuibacter silviterrae TaxID=1539049 RepID=A0A4R8DGF6_9BACT|nr:hypothetical protein [Dinghuibacter silviterrae]TDW96723.1 hypothetical protein EDB95_4559 [Dinghuibacter silviterrae]
MNILTLLLTAFCLTAPLQENGYLLQTDHYSILFPQKPTPQDQTVDSKIGPLHIHMQIYDASNAVGDGNVAYSVAETQYPDTSISSDRTDKLDKFFEATVNGAVNNVKGKLLSVAPIQLNGYPGRFLRIDYQDGVAVITMRAFLVKSTLYMMQTIAYTKNDHNAASEAFMKSFRLKTGK